MLRHRLRQDVGRVPYPHSTRRRGREVDVVVPDREVRDGAELRSGRIEDPRTDAVDQERENRVGTGNERSQLVGRIRIFRRPNRDVVAASPEELNGRRRNRVRNNNLHGSGLHGYRNARGGGKRPRPQCIVRRKSSALPSRYR